MSWFLGSELIKVFLALVVVPALYWIGWATIFLLLPKEDFARLTAERLFRTLKPNERPSDLIFSNEAMAIAFLGLVVVVIIAFILQKGGGVDIAGFIGGYHSSSPQAACNGRP